MQIIAHGGWGGEYVQNTVPSIRRAVPHVDAIEMDLRRCGSGEVVLFHDETLERAAGDPRRVDEVPWDELREVGLFGTDERVPRLTEILEIVPPDVGLNLEFKETGLADSVEEITAGHEHEVLVSSFWTEPIREIEALSWYPDTGYLFEESPLEGVKTALDLDCEYVHPHYECCLESPVVDDAHEAGLGVNVWTVDDRATLRAVEDRDVEGAIVDCSAVLEVDES